MNELNKIIKNAAKNPKIRKRWIEGDVAALKLRVDSFMKEREAINKEVKRIAEKINQDFFNGNARPGVDDEMYKLLKEVYEYEV